MNKVKYRSEKLHVHASQTHEQEKRNLTRKLSTNRGHSPYSILGLHHSCFWLEKYYQFTLLTFNQIN